MQAMKEKLVLLGLVLLVVVVVTSGVFGTIQTGNVGLRTTLGVISAEEIPPGLYFKWPFITTVQEFSGKDIAIDISDLTPKAKDNLSLRKLDLSIYYKVNPAAISELVGKYAAQSVWHEEGYMMPAYELVWRVARNAAYEEVARLDSLELDKNDKSVFVVSRVVIRSVQTDPSIEQSIQQAVANQKKLEAMQVQTEIAKKEAEIKVTEAHGIAEANKIISGSLTHEYLQHEANLALMTFAEKGNSNTVIVPAGMPVTPLINAGVK
jgi:regulator of protease activity HflC (stomatin/prohibitin superfamily)